MPTHKRTVHPGQPTPVSPPIAEPARYAGPASYAGPWDVDQHWSDDQEEIDDMADAERIAPAAAIPGWTDLEPLDVDALIGTARNPDEWGLHDTSQATGYGEEIEGVDDAEDQL